MARKFGKKNVVKVDPLAYQIALMGEGGIGKTTLIVEMVEKLAGSDSYIHLNVGKEDGISAIQGVIYEDVPDWTTFEEIIDDIVENKDTDYKDLRVITIDTIDELELLGEKEVVRLHNLKNPKDRTDSFNKAFGGFGRGYAKLEELVLDNVQKLKEVGVSVIYIGHVKRKTKTDPVTEKEYDVITAKMSNRLFTAIQTKLHILGLGVIDRSIEEEIIGKDIVGKDKKSKKIKTEKRVIKFRDDSFAVESKSRFRNIAPEVTFSADAFIKAITDAIQSEFDSKEDMDKARKVQDKEFKEKTQEKINQIKEEKEKEDKYGKKEDLINNLIDYYKDSATDDEKEAIKDKFKDIGISKFSQLEDRELDEVIEVYQIIEK